jgi:fucose permease
VEMIASGPDGRTEAVERRSGRVGVVAGMLLMPLAAIVLVTAALLRADGWAGAALVLAGALMLAAGVGLLSTPAHAEHVASRHRRTGGSTSPTGAPKPKA